MKNLMLLMCLSLLPLAAQSETIVIKIVKEEPGPLTGPDCSGICGTGFSGIYDGNKCVCTRSFVAPPKAKNKHGSK